MTASEIMAAALDLPERDQWALVEKLLESVDPGEPGLTEEDWLASWLPEIERRAEEFDQDPTIGIPADEVFASIRAALGTRS